MFIVWIYENCFTGEAMSSQKVMQAVTVFLGSSRSSQRSLNMSHRQNSLGDKIKFPLTKVEPMEDWVCSSPTMVCRTELRQHCGHVVRQTWSVRLYEGIHKRPVSRVGHVTY